MIFTLPFKLSVSLKASPPRLKIDSELEAPEF
jgi:hypothetical protein